MLAGGAGTRFTGPGHKLLAPLTDGRTVLAVAVGQAVEAAIGPVVVVAGALGSDELVALLGDTVTVVPNPAWRSGQASSLRVGVDWARASGATAVVVGLGDQPGLDPEAWRSVAAACGTPIARATYDGRPGHPVRLDAAIWDLLPTSGDRGAAQLLRERPDLVTEVACPGVPGDIDTAEDLTTWPPQP
ncbi:MAG: hypothetical protein JWN29_1626 [Acidimicrobiales bacterium]|nr:hypothetical protein [Acidimicrobiales bacterium]MCU1378643.1 hypothetical protein [Acidimicrobiales bacterium]